MSDGRYEIVVAGPAATAIAQELPESVAAAVIELITRPLLDNPRRVGVALRRRPWRGYGVLAEARTGSCTGSTTHIGR